MPTPQDYYAALVSVIETGEERKVGSIVLSPKREWPLNSEALMGLAHDLAKAEEKGNCERCG